MNLEFPYFEIPVKVSNRLIHSSKEFDETTIINGSNYRIGKSSNRIKIVYKINSVIDVFFLSFLQITEIIIPLDKEEISKHFCRIQIIEFLKILTIFSIIILGLVSLYGLFQNPKFGILFSGITILLSIIHYFFYKYAVRYIKHAVENDIEAIVNYCQNKIEQI